MKISADAALDELCVNTIRTLSIDAVQKANSGHPRFTFGCRAHGVCFMDVLFKAQSFKSALV